MEVIIAAIVVGVILLWAGILGLLRLIELYESKHILGLGAYTTIVAGLVMGLVLFTANQRQIEHRRQLQEQMDENSKRLGQLADQLGRQLVEKADLTASEFEVRAKLQDEKAHHERTRNELAEQKSQYEQLQAAMGRERQARIEYQNQQNQKQEERFAQEEERYKAIRDFLDVHRTTVGNIQKQLAGMQGNLVELRTQNAAVQDRQKDLLAQIEANRKQLAQEIARQTGPLDKAQQALSARLDEAHVKIDSLYLWNKKK